MFFVIDCEANECQKVAKLCLAEEECLELLKEGRAPGKGLPSSFLELGMTMEDLQ